MIVWLTASQALWVLSLSYVRVNGEHPVVSPIIKAALVAFGAGPLIYTVGWLLLPALGIGSIPFGGRHGG